MENHIANIDDTMVITNTKLTIISGITSLFILLPPTKFPLNYSFILFPISCPTIIANLPAQQTHNIIFLFFHPHLQSYLKLLKLLKKLLV